MIAGTDMAAAALEPHEFLDVLRGRLNRRFIHDADHLRRRLDALDERPDPDGSHRVEDLFCQGNMWRAALVELIGRCDCVLVDARGFTTGHQGVAYEITQLVQLVPLRLVLVLTDDLTDRAYLTAVVDEAWRSRPTAPIPETIDELRILPDDTTGGPDPEVVTGLLATAGEGPT
jgi:hypothetical protein